MAIRFTKATPNHMYWLGLLRAAQPYTIMGWFRPVSLPGGAGVYHNYFAQMMNGGGDTGCGVSLFRSGAASTTRWNLGTSSSDSTGGSLPVAGTWYHVTLVQGTATNDKTMYIDGVSTATSTNTEGNTTNVGLAIFDTGGGSDQGDFRVRHFRVWNAALTRAEILKEMRSYLPQKWQDLRLAMPARTANETHDISGYNKVVSLTTGAYATEDDPPNILQQFERTNIFYPSAAPSAATITLTSGSYSLSGQSAAMKRAIAMTAGSYALTGNSLNMVRRVSLTTGTYALTGNSLTLLRQVSLTCGTYGLTGNGLSVKRTLVTTSGNYSLTGNAATVKRQVSLTSGSYGLIGNSASLGRTYVLTSGSYGLTGNATAVKRTFFLTAGTYGLTGYDLTFVHSGTEQEVDLTSGTYAETGYPVGVSRRISLASGSYSTTGNATSLQRRVPCVAGSYGLTGNSVSIGRRVAGAAGSYIISGQSLVMARRISLTSGSYLVGGQGLTVKRTLALVSGTYTQTGQGVTVARFFTMGSGSYLLTGYSVSVVDTNVNLLLIRRRFNVA